MRIFLILFLLSGCTTQLWKEESYSEQLSGFYLVPESSHLIVRGKEYSYIFDVDEQFSKVLLASSKIEFSPRFTEFKLDQNNNISGDVYFSVSAIGLTQAEKESLGQLGFQASKDSPLNYNASISGERYELEGDLPFMSVEGEYFVTVKTPRSFVSTAKKILATPATIAFDAIVVTPLTVVVVLTMASGSP